jgi:hypothetical protein
MNFSPVARREVSAAFRNRKVLVVADYDSFVKAAIGLSLPLEDQGATLVTRLVTASRGQLSAGQAAALGLSQRPESRKLADVVDEALSGDYDIVVISLDGSRIRRFLNLFATRLVPGRPRPLLVTGYPGIIFRLHLNGFMDRAPVDLLCLTSRFDRDLYANAVLGLKADPSNAVVTGLSITWRMDRMHRRHAKAAATHDAIVYFDQPTVPPSYAQRAYVVDRLIDLARRNPDTKVLLKPRHRPDETTIHWTQYHLADLVAEHPGPLPANFAIVYDSVPDLLDRARLTLTFSSTAAIESMRAGVPARLIADFSVSEQTGVSFFAGSGCLATFADLGPDMPDSVDREWLETAAGPADGERIYLEALGDLLRRRDEVGGALPMRPLSPFHGSREWFDFATARFGPKTAAHPRRILWVPFARSILHHVWRTVYRFFRG